MKLALCQFDMAWEDREANKKKIVRMLDEGLRGKKADWLVFPEMTLSGFTMDLAKSTVDASDLEFFSSLAKEHGLWLSCGVVQDGRNNLLTFDRSGRQVSSYSKIHLYSFGKEDKHYRAGERPERFQLEGFSVAPAVCFDLRFPHLFWDAAAKTDVYVVIASWPAKRAEHWMTLLRARAIENQAYVVGVNRTGADPTPLEYSGNSMAFDPLGRVVLDCGSREGVQVAEVDVDRAQIEKTRTRFPFLNDRR
ncbi:MAG: nitrilase-related carbon-nitrogen hydrolase [Elusimicrobiota bacterium]|jgi:predicted amidohydrolase